MTEEELEEAWGQRRCAGLEPSEADRLFYSSASRNQAEGRRLCILCPLRVPCALEALEQDRAGEYLPYGLRGGLTAGERATILGREGTGNER